MHSARIVSASRLAPLAFLAVLTLFGAPAGAVDISSCAGAFVADGDTGVLQADIHCTPPNVVTLGKRATLAMNGHSIQAGGTLEWAVGAIRCVGHCRVQGPGEIFGRIGGVELHPIGPQLVQRLVISDVSIHDATYGIQDVVGYARVTATNVSVTGCRGTGILAGALRATNVTSSGNERGIVFIRQLRAVSLDVSNNRERGIRGSTVVRSKLMATGLTATDNGAAGIDTYSAGLKASTVTGNDAGGAGIDISTIKAPRLFDTTCGKSFKNVPPDFGDWDVCTND